MIARDEAPRIVRALASVRPHVDEMSCSTPARPTPPSRSRAPRAPRVARFAWCDDFAAARNAALALADADWNLSSTPTNGSRPGSRRCWPCGIPAGIRRAAARRQPASTGTGGVAAGPLSWLPRVLPRGVRYAGPHPRAARACRLPVRRLARRSATTATCAEALRARRPQPPPARDGARRGARRRLPAYQLGKDHDVYGRWAEAAHRLHASRAPASWPPRVRTTDSPAAAGLVGVRAGLAP